MFKRRKGKTPLLVVFMPDKRIAIMTHAHEKLGHRGVHGVFYHIRDRFFWPHLFQDVKHHVSSCHECQIWSTKRVEIPPTIRSPVTIFTQIYVDVMFMPKAHGYHYIVAARDDLTHAVEGRALKKANSTELARFFWEEIICRYGHITEVVTDNGSEMAGAFEKLLQRYEIPQIRISPYNTHATGLVEQGHFVIRESILKDCGKKISSWPYRVPHAFFADKITIRRSTGFSPYFLMFGTDPVLPFDLTEATFLVKGFKSGMSTAELLALRLRQLEKRPADVERAAQTIVRARIRSKAQFEQKFEHR